jgi:hypothetical protein
MRALKDKRVRRREGERREGTEKERVRGALFF